MVDGTELIILPTPEDDGTNGTPDGPETLSGTEKQRARFIAYLRDTANVRASCAKAGLNRSTIYRWRKRWATFRREWDDALEDACDILEGAARDLALNGNAQLLQFLLKAHRPAVYGDRARLDMIDVNLAMLTEKQLERLANGEDPINVLATTGEG